MSDGAGPSAAESASTIRRGDLKYVLLAAGVLLVIVGIGSAAATMLELCRGAWPSPSRQCEDFHAPEDNPQIIGTADGGSISWFPVGIRCDFDGDDFRDGGWALKNPSLRPTAYLYGGLASVGLGIGMLSASRRVRMVAS